MSALPFRYLAAMTLGCAFGCARAAIWWRAQTNSELSYANGYMDQNPNSDPVQAALLHSEINKYWAPQQLLLSLEKLCNTFADIQVPRSAQPASIRFLDSDSICN